MLTVKDIRKEYRTGNLVQKALDGVSVSFREREFVAVLGPSGSGKTTLLNIIGGLDGYDSGEMSVNGVPTSRYGNRDWDTYRNRTIGFVFQSYNLIPHQTILSNVELAMTLAGVGRAERKKRALEALDRVGLADQAHKKPNQLSGGQMQRVAIARALVNEPAIVLADEPTGALDSDTGEQVIRILKEISQDHLVVMVTHNADLADRYATRVVKLKDGQVTEDTDPYDPEAPAESAVQTEAPEECPTEGTTVTDGTSGTGVTTVTNPNESHESHESHETARVKRKKLRKPSMSFATAFSLSVSNLWSKKARTILVAIATSIGIIGIALILSLSNGANNYIKRIETESLSQYPLTIPSSAFSGGAAYANTSDPEAGEASVNTLDTSARQQNDQDGSTNIRELQMMGRLLASARMNDLGSLKAWFESGESTIEQYTRGIEYDYDVSPQIYRISGENVIQVSPSQMLSALGMGSLGSFASLMADFSFGEAFSALPRDEELYINDYEILAGNWPADDSGCVLVLSDSDSISDMLLYTLGLKDQAVLQDRISGFVSGDASGIGMERSRVYKPQDFIGISFRVLPASDRYEYDSRLGIWMDISSDNRKMLDVLSDARELKITGVVTPKEGVSYGILGTGVAYRPTLVEDLIRAAAESAIVRQQLASPQTDVLTGKAFGEGFKLEDISVLDFLSFHPEYISEAIDIDLDTFVPEDLRITQEKLDAVVREVRATGSSRTLAGMFRAGIDFLANMVEIDREKLTKVISFSVDEARLRDLLSSESVSEQSTFAGNLKNFGYADPTSPSSISIYPRDFEGKNEVVRILDEYNASMRKSGQRAKVIVYTDYIGALTSSITTIIDVITYVLIAFVSVSLVVSSIMIGIITYISVLERRKEIGILRALGASKRNITQVFNAETFIIGILSGAIGILMTLLLQIPINHIIRVLSEEDGIRASLPAGAGLVLVLLCVILTFIGGFIPSRKAARQNPVTALRSE